MKRSYTKMDYDNSDIPNKVALVERNITPQGIPLINPTAIAKRSSNDLVELAMEIQNADNYIVANACNKLKIIVDQVNFLKKQAKDVLTEVQQNATLHHAACNFLKHPGHVYHLYQRESGQTYFSMLSPEEWGNSGPSQTYKGSFRLEQDHSWTPLSQIYTKDDELTVINRLLQSNECITISTINNNMSIDS